MCGVAGLLGKEKGNYSSLELVNILRYFDLIKKQIKVQYCPAF